MITKPYLGKQTLFTDSFALSKSERNSSSTAFFNLSFLTIDFWHLFTLRFYLSRTPDVWTNFERIANKDKWQVFPIVVLYFIFLLSNVKIAW